MTFFYTVVWSNIRFKVQIFFYSCHYKTYCKVIFMQLAFLISISNIYFRQLICKSEMHECFTKCICLIALSRMWNCLLMFLGCQFMTATWAAEENNLISSTQKTQESHRKTVCSLFESSFWMIVSMFLRWRWGDPAFDSQHHVWERVKVTFWNSMQGNSILCHVLRGIYCIFSVGQ